MFLSQSPCEVVRALPDVDMQDHVPRPLLYDSW